MPPPSPGLPPLSAPKDIFGEFFGEDIDAFVAWLEQDPEDDERQIIAKRMRIRKKQPPPPAYASLVQTRARPGGGCSDKEDGEEEDPDEFRFSIDGVIAEGEDEDSTESENDGPDVAGEADDEGLLHGPADLPDHGGDGLDGEEDGAEACGGEEAVPEVRRKPAAAESRNLCHGCVLDGQRKVCIFSTTTMGGKAKYTKNSRCSFCSDEHMKHACGTSRGRGIITRSLKTFYNWRAKRPDIHEEAIARVRRWCPDRADEMESSSIPKPTAAERRAKSWETAKALRQSTMAEPSGALKRKYREEVVEDQRVAKRRFFSEAPRRRRARAEELEMEVDNDAGLPKASHSELSQGLQRWFERGAFGSCKACQSLQARPMHERDLFQDPGAELPKSQCKRCSARRPPYVPKPEDQPEPLRGLTEEAVDALRIFEIDVGPEVRATTQYGLATGYRKHVKMIRFSWAAQSVKRKIHAMTDRQARRRAKAAYEYLKDSEESCYGDFLAAHKRFLQKHGRNAAEKKRLRPCHIMEEVGIECAVWPQLYWRTDMCETYERSTDCRREAQPKRKRDDSDDDDSDDDSDDGDDSDDEATEGQRHSMKRSFLAKLQSPLLGYSGNFELLQFVYDLNLWSTLGSKKNLETGVPLRVMMAGHSFSPLYWKRVHNGLVELDRSRTEWAGEGFQISKIEETVRTKSPAASGPRPISRGAGFTKRWFSSMNNPWKWKLSPWSHAVPHRGSGPAGWLPHDLLHDVALRVERTLPRVPP